MKVKLLFFLISIFFQFNIFAQNNTSCKNKISGYIIDEHDNMPLQYAIIYIKGTKLGATTDDSGYFEIQQVCSGWQTFTIQHFDCDTKDIKIELSNDTILKVFMEHHEHLLNEIQIKSHKHDDKNTITQEIISNEELTKKQGFSLSEMLKLANGVQLLQNGNTISKPVLHGMYGNRLPIINDGVRLESQSWGNEHAPEIDAFAIEEAKVIKGAMGLRYGLNAIAGAIVLQSKPFSDTALLQISSQTVLMSNGKNIAQSGYLSIVFPKLNTLGIRVQGTFKRSGNYKSPDYFLENTGTKEYNYSAQIQYKYKQAKWNIISSRFNNDIGIFSGSHIGNITDLETAIALAKPNTASYFSYDIKRPYQQVFHEVLKMNYYQKFSSFHKVNINISRQYNRRYEYDAHSALNDSIAALNKPEFRMQLETYNCEILWEQKWHNLLNGQLGANIIAQQNIVGGLRSFLPAYTSKSLGLWLIQKYLNEKYEVEGGIRFDIKNATYEIYTPLNNTVQNVEKKFQGISGNVGFIYKGFSHSKITYNIGKAWRAPDANELFANGVHHGTASVEIGNQKLEAEQAINQGLSYEGAFSKWNFKADVYLNYIKNFIYIKPQKPPTLSIRGAFPTFYFLQTDVLFYGSDFKIEYHISAKNSLTQKVNFLRVDNIKAHTYIDKIAPNSIETVFSNSFNPIKFINVSNLQISIATMFKQNRYNEEEEYKASPPAYTLLNVNYEFHPNIFHQKLDVNVGINNLLNTSYRNYLDNMRYYTDAIGRNVFIQLKFLFAKKL
jgi:iron complex outermembrane receptor protein